MAMDSSEKQRRYRERKTQAGKVYFQAWVSHEHAEYFRRILEGTMTVRPVPKKNRPPVKKNPQEGRHGSRPDLVERARQMRAEGLTWMEIAKQWELTGIKGPRVGRPYTAGTICNMVNRADRKAGSKKAGG